MLSHIIVLVSAAVGVSIADRSFKHCATSFDEPSQSTLLTCKNLNDEMALYDDLKLARDVSQLLIEDSSLRFFVHGTFHHTKFEGIVLKNSHLLGFTNGEVAFDGLQDHLLGIILQNCTFVDSLNWDQLRELRSLAAVAIRGSDLEYIPDLSALTNNPKLSLIDITDDRVSDIHPKALNQLKHITFLKISNNRIQSLQRSMLPDPAQNLIMIDVSYNSLTSLPKDMFSNMPRLRTIILNNNKITTIDEDVFSNVVGRLSVLILKENPTSCDCRLRWLTKLHLKSPKLQAICDSPSAHKGKRVNDLEGSDLWC